MRGVRRGRVGGRSELRSSRQCQCWVLDEGDSPEVVRMERVNE